MRNKCLGVIMLSFGLSFAPNAQTMSKDEMVHKIFTALHDKNEAAFVDLFPTGSILRGYVLDLISVDEHEKIDSATLQSLLKMLSDSTLHGEYVNMYHKAIDKGEEKNIVWNNTVFVSYTADSIHEEDDHASALKGKIYFDASRQQYYLAFGDVTWFDKGKPGWWGAEIKRIGLKGEEKTVEEMVDKEMELNNDSAIMMTDTTAKTDTAVSVLKSKPKTKIVKPSGTKTGVPVKAKPKNTSAANKQ